MGGSRTVIFVCVTSKNPATMDRFYRYYVALRDTGTYPLALKTL